MTGPLLLAALLATAPSPRARHAAAEATPPSLETAALAHLVDLASDSTFVLVVEPGASRVSLLLQGAVLREYPIEAMELATPRVAFAWRRGDSVDARWLEQVWRSGVLVPTRKRDRIEIDAAPPDPNRTEASEDVPVPPPPEEMIIAPERFFVRFAGGMALEVRATPARRSRFEAWKTGWGDRIAALRPHSSDRARLRLFLAPDDSDAFYRSLPPDVSLLILPPTLRADGTEIAAAAGE
ncbi:MAG: hypothetical protein U0167_02675 [bacterium]